LGPVEISYAQQPLKIPRRVERGILYFLAAENRTVTRTQLIDLLWPEANQVDPRGALRTALSRLRNHLPDKTHLVTELDQVSLDFTRCKIDLVRFQETYLSLQGLLSAFPNKKPLPVQIFNQIKEALNLWRGDEVIQGDDLSDYPELEAWRQRLNRNLSQQREILMKRLADHYQADGQLDWALDVYIQLGRMNHLDISTHLSVIDILIKLGRLQESLEFCDALEVIFEREYKAPLPDEILERCHHAQMLLNANLGRPEQEWPIPLSIQLPLIGRTTELRLLRQAYFRGGLVKIQGEMGVGKTRLVQELFVILSPKPVLISAPAKESESALPLAPFVHALRRYVPDEIWAEIDTVWVNQLSMLLPELTEMRQDCSPSSASKWPSAKQHLFDALYHLLLLVVRKYGRILFFLDDAHWADHQTVEALSYLVAQDFFDEHGLLIISTWVEQTNHRIDEMFNQFYRTHHLQTITLHNLNPDELRLLTLHASHQPPSWTFLDQLFQETNGNPFLALEIIRHIMEMSIDISEPDSIDRLPLPESVHVLIRSRLNQLSDDSHRVLTCAAVIGSDISPDLLQAVSNIHQHRFMIALDPLIRSGILQLNKEGQADSEKLEFIHEKMREVVIKETSPTYLQILHQTVARQLSEGAQSMDKAAVIAEHFAASGDTKNAFQWFLQAAAHAWFLGAAVDVNRAYQQAERLLQNTPQTGFTIDDIFKLYKAWSDFAFQSHKVDVLEEVGVKLQQCSDEKLKPHLIGLSNYVLARACFLREDYDTGLMLSESAINTLENLHHQETVIQALFQKALLQWWTIDFDGMVTTTHQIEERIEDMTTDSQQMTSCEFNTRRLICEMDSNKGAADQAQSAALSIFREYFPKLDTFDRLRAFIMLANAHFINGQFDDCKHFSREGIKIAQALDNNVLTVLLLINLCKSEIVRGQLDDAYLHATQALELAEADNKVQTVVAVNTLLGDIFVILRDYNQALHYYRIAQVRQGYFFQSYYGLENNIHLGRALTWTGQIAEAREILKITLELTHQKGIMVLYIQALMIDGLCDLFEMKDTEAEAKFSSVVEIAEENGLRQDYYWGKFLFARLQMTRKEFVKAEETLIEVLEGTTSHKMTLLTLFVFDLLTQLQKVHHLRMPAEVLTSSFDALLHKLDSQTQSPPLREVFLDALGYWRAGRSQS
jgi:DNA-binding SARP family transcriptional activator